MVPMMAGMLMRGACRSKFGKGELPSMTRSTPGLMDMSRMRGGWQNTHTCPPRSLTWGAKRMNCKVSPRPCS